MRRKPSDFTEEEIAVAMVLHKRRREKAHMNSPFCTVPMNNYDDYQLRIMAIADLIEQESESPPHEESR